MLLIIFACIFMSSRFSFGHALTPQPTPIYSFRIKQTANQTWGYQIFKGDKMMIDQPTIPGVSGENGFMNAKQARLVAQKVIQKLKKGIFPPQVDVEELKQWGITIQP